eukprot:TRINITY_DN48273_c0_g1_i1.p1 TRINITY_DN48273_c0_g1~~TRINITY_DN48273_c0_g1_i1.p1  ORF type:complete len:386 (+),score=94.38 TRINITY_DN48273_c0_g1_i1:206-1363(+)
MLAFLGVTQQRLGVTTQTSPAGELQATAVRAGPPLVLHLLRTDGLGSSCLAAVAFGIAARRAHGQPSRSWRVGAAGRRWRRTSRVKRRQAVQRVVDIPTDVEGYCVKPISIDVPQPLLDSGRHALFALVCSDEEDYEDCEIVWELPPGSGMQQAISNLRDSFGVMGIWPAAWIAAEQVLALCTARKEAVAAGTADASRPLRILEIGCGLGLPSLLALAEGAEVVATDLEKLPLDLLEAAAEAQDLPGKLETFELDVLDAMGMRSAAAGGLVRPPSFPKWLESGRFDAIVCSDCLYKVDVAAAIGRLVGKLLQAVPRPVAIVTDANRQGRQRFLEELAASLPPHSTATAAIAFEPTVVPSWAADSARDPFDGTETSEAGLLKVSLR